LIIFLKNHKHHAINIIILKFIKRIMLVFVGNNIYIYIYIYIYRVVKPSLTQFEELIKKIKF